MRIIKEKLSSFVLENKYFDQLINVNDIALYAILSRLDGVAWSENIIMKEWNISKRSFDKSIKKLLEIGFLELNKDI